MPINASERSDVKLLEKLARQKAAQSAEVLKGIMSNPFGREWMYDLLERCHIGASPFSSDPLIMAHNCGEANIGLRLWADLMNICPDQYTLMAQEHNERSILPDTITERSRSADAHGGVESSDDSAWDTRPGAVNYVDHHGNRVRPGDD